MERSGDQVVVGGTVLPRRRTVCMQPFLRARRRSVPAGRSHPRQEVVVRTRDEILAQFKRIPGQAWEVTSDRDSRWRAAQVEVLLDIRGMLLKSAEASKATAAGDDAV